MIQKILPSFERNDEEFVKKNGKRKAFFTGGNSSCRQHIRQHYTIYQERCKEADLPEHHWAIPRPLWRKMQEGKRGEKVTKQGTLDGMLVETLICPAFTRENVLHMVMQFVAVDDQVRPNRRKISYPVTTDIYIPLVPRCCK
jgi:hypothetical protein